MVDTVRFTNDDPYGLWKAGELADDLGQESSHPDAPNIRLLRPHLTGETICLTAPFERGLIEKWTKMDRGIVVDNVRTPTSDIQICRFDLGDAGNPTVFVTAYANPVPMDPIPDAPNTYFDDPAWPEFTTPEELDEFIGKLQAQRAWLAETDPIKREEI